MYHIGYYNKPWSKNNFVILAQTKNYLVACFIIESYNTAYERNGISTRVILLKDDQLPENYRFSEA